MWLSFARNASLLATLMLVSTTNFAQDYYKWVDSQGTTHYTKTPPPKSSKNLGKVATQGFHNSAPTKVVETEVPPNQPPITVQPPPTNATTPSEAPAAEAIEPAKKVALDQQQRDANQALNHAQKRVS